MRDADRQEAGLAPEASSYLAHLRRSGTLSENTLRAYSEDIRALCRWLDGHSLCVSDLDHARLRSYLGDLVRAGYSERTVNRRLSSTRGLLLWLSREGVAVGSGVGAIPGRKRTDAPRWRRCPGQGTTQVNRGCSGGAASVSLRLTPAL